MTVGAPQDKNAIDNRAYSLAVQMRDLLVEIQNFQAFLATKTSQNLMDLTYTQSEVDLLKSAFTQLDAGRLVLLGQATQPAANNFLFFSNQLVGPN